MLRKKAPETIAANLTIKGQGEQTTFAVTYYNRTADQMSALFDEGRQPTIEDIVLYVVKDWAAEYALSTADLKELRDSRPGVLEAVMQGYHEARKVELVKN